MEDTINVDWFKKRIAPCMGSFEIKYKFFKDGDFGSLNQVEFNSKRVGGNIDFWGTDRLGIFVWDYNKEIELMNILLNPDQEKEKQLLFKSFLKIIE
jgi:hypothetical protein